MEQLQQTARGKEARYDDCIGKLKISYDDHVKIIEDRNVIAVTEIRTSHEEAIPAPFYNILQLQTPTSVTGGNPFSFEAVPATALPASFLERHLGPSKPSCLHVPSTADGKPNFHIVISVRSGLGEAEHFLLVLSVLL